MRIVILATGAFAVPTIEWLVVSGHRLLGLVSRPAPLRRHSRTRASDSPAVVAAGVANIPVVTPPSVNDPEFGQELSAWQADLFFVCDYGEILSARTLSLTRLGGINLHGSLLPAYRGAAPVAWAILEGQRETGVTVIHMTPRLDAGPILSQAHLTIEPDDDAVSLEHRLGQLGVGTAREAIDLLQVWDGKSPIGRPQDASLASKAPRLHRGQGEIDWNRSATEIFNQVRALQPWPGAFTHCRSAAGDRLKLQIIRTALREPSAATPSLPGTILRDPQGGMSVMTGSGPLQLTLVRPENRKAMSGSEFLRGYRLDDGDRVGS
jgi:methionyl-tRNA formyltransferase